jgi:hypothetical protein
VTAAASVSVDHPYQQLPHGFGLPWHQHPGAAPLTHAKQMSGFGGGGGDAPALLVGGLLSVKAAAAAALLALGTVAYRLTEGLSWVDSAYCATGVITTVGQVIVPRTPLGRLFTAVFNVASLGLGALFLMEVADARRAQARRLLQRATGRTSLLAASSSSLRVELAALLAVALPSILGAALAFQYIEGWKSYAEAAYFALIVATGARGRRWRRVGAGRRGRGRGVSP